MIDDVRLPEKWSKGSSGGAAFLTRIVTTESGAEDREERWANPLWRYDIAHNVKSAAGIAELRGFHLARRGASRGFLLKDWIDFTSAADGVAAAAAGNQPLGTGTGAQTVFLLIKRHADVAGTFDRAVLWPVTGSVLIAVNAIPLAAAGFTVQRGAGTVTFAVAPAAAAVLTAGFAFDVPVRFGEDLLSVSWDTINSRSVGSVPLFEVRA